MTTITTKEPALYESYSMGILWNMTALTPEEFNAAAVAPTPLDGDALARTAASERRLAEAWKILDAAKIERLRRNHDEIDRCNR